VRCIDGLAQLAAELTQRLRRGPRVLKQQRGHSGLGVWRVEAEPDGMLRVRHAQRGSAEQRLSMDQLAATLAPYFEAEAGGHMIDQPWQPRLAEGMVRAYLVEDRVAGFGHQAVNALHPTEPQPGARLYSGPELEPFQDLRGHLEGVWVRERHEHEHTHEVMEHSHRHEHDEHHRHEHAFAWDSVQPHAHPHRHESLTHKHPHYPDDHHRHGHG
jgi:hypothetical protein